MCPPGAPESARMHSLRQSSDLFTSAPSSRFERSSDCALAAHSEPARSISESFAAGAPCVPSRARCRWICSTACERDDVSFCAVERVVRLAVRTMLMSSRTEPSVRISSPTMHALSFASAITSIRRFAPPSPTPSRSYTLPRYSSKKPTLTVYGPARIVRPSSSARAKTCAPASWYSPCSFAPPPAPMPIIVIVLPEPVWPYAKHMAWPPLSNSLSTSGCTASV
mmetsp:Transcript_9405/g.24342  ORF Transcript_9405/g.24342 Transcript_9405/m.24342 type:complete len:224 (+) Transcript_9405:224-895(+)